jgi:hypothetical protein
MDEPFDGSSFFGLQSHKPDLQQNYSETEKETQKTTALQFSSGFVQQNLRWL